MTEFKKGDRVKVTIEGVVIRDQSARDLFLNVDRADYPAHHVVDTKQTGVTIEKLADPLPTTPGSVIVSKATGIALLLHYDKTWHGRTGSSVRPAVLDPVHWDVLRDAGAQR